MEFLELLSAAIAGGFGAAVGGAIRWLYHRWRDGRAEARQVMAAAHKAEAEADAAEGAARSGHYSELHATMTGHMEELQRVRVNSDKRADGIQEQLDELRGRFQELQESSALMERTLRDTISKLERRLERLANGGAGGKGGAAGIVSE